MSALKPSRGGQTLMYAHSGQLERKWRLVGCSAFRGQDYRARRPGMAGQLNTNIEELQKIGIGGSQSRSQGSVEILRAWQDVLESGRRYGKTVKPADDVRQLTSRRCFLTRIASKK